MINAKPCRASKDTNLLLDPRKDGTFCLWTPERFYCRSGTTSVGTHCLCPPLSGTRTHRYEELKPETTVLLGSALPVHNVPLYYNATRRY